MYERLGLNIKKLDAAIEKQASSVLGAQGLTVAQMDVMMVLLDAGDEWCTMKELKQALSVSQPTMVGLVKRLEKKGLVECRIDSSIDRHVKLVTLSRSGRSVCKLGSLQLDVAERKLLEGFSTGEQADMMRLLRKLYANVK